MRNKNVAIMLLITIFTLSVGGFFAMSIMNHITGNSCPFDMTNSSPCPQSSGVVIALHHINSFKDFSRAIFIIQLMSMFILFVSFAVVTIYFNKVPELKEKNYCLNFILKNYKKLHEEIYFFNIILLRRIISIHKLYPKDLRNKAFDFVSA